MKHLLSRLTVFAAAWICPMLSAVAQDAPPKAAIPVDIKDRLEAEAAVRRLGEKSAKHFKSAAVRTLVKPPSLPPASVLMPPDAEKKHEASLAPPQRQSLARNASTDCIDPEVVRSQNGELLLKLEAAYAHNRIGEDPVYLRAFNGKLVGPTLRAKPGDTLRITLKNTMPPERWLPNMMNTLNHFNTTNMHYHGLHVSPNGISDNVLIQVGPQETQHYVVKIPENHTAGTYWYHPHRHGSTAGNVASGMSGALIIEGGLDDIPEIRKAGDRVMVLNQIPYIYKNILDGKPVDLKEGVVEVKYQEYIFGPGTWPTLGRYTTINGVQLPVIRMRPGRIERWRLIDSGQRERIDLKIIPAPTAGGTVPPQINFQEIAVDGLALGKMVETTTIELWPGYRSDVLVQAPAVPGEYLLIDDAISGSATMSGQDKPLNYVARISIAGEPDVMKLPTNQQMEKWRLPAIKDSEITGKQDVEYGILLVSGKVVFTIDSKAFDMETARQLKLNDVDEWTIRTNNQVAGGFVTHPFHIHVNPFEVTSIMAPVLDAVGNVVMENGKPQLEEQLKNGPVWRDTVKIPGNGYVKMRTRYTDFIGTFVQHCHILDHEDQGMMQLIDIVSDETATAANRPAIPDIDSVAPNFTLPDAAGKKHSLAEIQGQPAVVFFFKGHGCLHCARQVAAFIEHHESFAKNGIEVIGVTSDSVESLKVALDSFPCPFTLLADPEGVAFAKFGCATVAGLQHGTFTLDAEQQVTWRTVGSSPYLAIEGLVEKLLPRTSTQTDITPGSKHAYREPLTGNVARAVPQGILPVPLKD